VAFELGQHGGVVGGLADDGYEVVILRRRAQQRRTADVDVLDAGREVGAARHRRLEGVEVHHDQVDRCDAVRLHRTGMRLLVAPRQDAAVDLRMQRLDPAVHDLGKAGVCRDLGDRDAGRAQGLGGAAGRQDLDVARRKGAAELD